MLKTGIRGIVATSSEKPWGSRGLYVGPEVSLNIRTHCLPPGNVKEVPTLEPCLKSCMLSLTWIRSDNHVASHFYASRSTLKIIPPPVSDVSLVLRVVIVTITYPFVELGNDRKLWKSVRPLVLSSHLIQHAAIQRNAIVFSDPLAASPTAVSALGSPPTLGVDRNVPES